MPPPSTDLSQDTSIAAEIVSWFRDRAPWQSRVIRDLAKGEVYDTAAVSGLVDQLLSRVGPVDSRLQLKDLRVAVAGDPPVTIISLGNLQGINALDSDAPLAFSPNGITVVYGDNGSGKSGYARLLKRVSAARHDETILTDVFQQTRDAKQKAQLTFAAGSESRALTWPDDESVDLARVSYYDEACGAVYLERQSEVSYRPSILSLLDGLVSVCEAVRSEIDRRLSELSAARLPEVPAGTKAALLVDGLSHRTKVSDIDAVTSLVGDDGLEIAAAEAEVARLRSTNPEGERRRLLDRAADLDCIAQHVNSLGTELGGHAEAKLAAQFQSWVTKSTAAKNAGGAIEFGAEALTGTGSEVWHELWESARRFSLTVAYPDCEFPQVSDGARCVLCQGVLNDATRTLLGRFESFVLADLDEAARRAEAVWKKSIAAIASVRVEADEIRRALLRLEDDAAGVATKVRAAIHSFQSRKAKILELKRCDQLWMPLPLVPEQTFSTLRDQAIQLRADAERLDATEFNRLLRQAQEQLNELRGAAAVRVRQSDFVEEIRRQKLETQLERAKRESSTRGISRKAGELHRKHVNEVLRDRFTRESDRLGLEGVTLRDAGSRKAKLLHQPGFVGAVQRKAKLNYVLSEGEQTALGLAGFFTETHLDASRSAMVLDDPVSSLDHGRRRFVAKRLVEFALDRQVIVFTHDVAFVVDLRSEAERRDVVVTERMVERRARRPGLCSERHPWKAKDAKSRLGELEIDLARIRRDQDSWNSDRYERESSGWAGRLSETWERMVRLEVVGQVVDSGSLEVRPRMFRLLAKVTDDDDRQFQSSYGLVSRWARRHDKSPEIGYVAPGVDEMASELALAREWFKRVKKYRS